MYTCMQENNTYPSPHAHTHKINNNNNNNNNNNENKLINVYINNKVKKGYCVGKEAGHNIGIS